MFCGCDIKQPVHRLPYFKEKRYCFRGIFDVANCDIKVNNTKSTDSGAIYILKGYLRHGFKIISCEGDGDDSGFEPDSVRRWIKHR